MGLRFSSGLRAFIAAEGSLREALEGGEIRVYSGPVPASVDSAIGVANILLYTLRADTDDGLTFEDSAPAGLLVKNTAEVWIADAVASGAPTFYRHCLASDTGVASTAAPRIQGVIGVAGADMYLSSPMIEEGASQKLEAYSISLPEV